MQSFTSSGVRIAYIDEPAQDGPQAVPTPVGLPASAIA